MSLDFQLIGLYQLTENHPKGSGNLSGWDISDLLQMTQKSIPKNSQHLTIVPVLPGEKWRVGGAAVGSSRWVPQISWG